MQLAKIARQGGVIALALLVGWLALGAGRTAAQGPTLSFDWWSAAAGGATESASGSYALQGTIGELSADEATGGAYTLEEGFLPTDSAAAARYLTYMPMLIDSEAP